MKTSRRRRKHTSSGRKGPSGGDDPPEGGGADEAVAVIGETASGLRKLAERHDLRVLRHLLGMVELEAEEQLRLRSKRKLS